MAMVLVASLTTPPRPHACSVLHTHATRRCKPGASQPVVEALQALRGGQCTVAVTTVAARGDLTRFENPRQLMNSLGLTPSEYSSGARRQQGSITKTGNTHARRALVAGAWAYRYPAKVSRHLQLRLEKLPTALQAISWKAQVRLCTRYRQLMATRQTCQSGRRRHCPRMTCLHVGHCQAGCRDRRKPKDDGGLTHKLAQVSHRLIGRDAAPVWCNPRRRYEAAQVPSSLAVRQAPDGGKEGGSQPTDISMINRRVFLAPALPIDTKEKTGCRRKKVAPNS